ncbi:MAG: 16S rRNA (cytosine(1402)-N(4))-methyltransferase RsmH [Miltoncostaeaceae bacterium]
MPSALPIASHRPSGGGHEPVLVEEVLAIADPGPGATVVDCTFGAGGHAAAIAPYLGPEGLYIAIDQDPEAIAWFEDLTEGVECATRFVRGNFAAALADLADEGVRADIVLMDLGLSSMQIDQPHRGFSYSRQAPLDMRMDPTVERSAADVVAGGTEQELTRIIRTYGEERYARQIARAIVRRRVAGPITTTGDLVEVVRQAVPTPALFAGGHPAKRVFQALRIEVNRELEVLEEGLEHAFSLLAPGGRLAVISFHSLEDRMVKSFMRDRARGCICPPDMPVCGCGRVPQADLVGGKARMPRPNEVERNPRARPSRLRGLRRREET